jgi:tripeptidyl-peptidase-1
MRIEVVFQILAALAVATSASPITTTSSHVVHERRNAIPHQWSRRSRLRPESVFPVRIGLAQQNLHRAEEFINQVAHPESKEYGKHWSAQEVADMFAPAPESVEMVKEWLVASGIDLERVRMSKSRNWLTFDATASEAERLLQTEYHLYKHDGGHEHIACQDYSIPSHLAEHIDIVTPTIHFDKKIGNPRRTQHHQDLPPPLRELNKRAELTKRQESKVDASKPHAKIGSPEDQSNPKQGAIVSNALMTLENCDTMITPACLQALYNMPPGSMAMKNNTLGVVEYTPQAFLQSDLDMYFRQFAPSLTQTAPNVKLVIFFFYSFAFYSSIVASVR